MNASSTAVAAVIATLCVIGAFYGLWEHLKTVKAKAAPAPSLIEELEASALEAFRLQISHEADGEYHQALAGYWEGRCRSLRATVADLRRKDEAKGSNGSGFTKTVIIGVGGGGAAGGGGGGSPGFGALQASGGGSGTPSGSSGAVSGSTGHGIAGGAP